VYTARQKGRTLLLAVVVTAAGCAPAPEREETQQVPPQPSAFATSEDLARIGGGISWVGCSSANLTVRDSPGASTRVEICAASYAPEVPDRRTIPDTGLLIARLRNQGAGIEERWGLEPNDTAFIVLYPRSATSPVTAEKGDTIVARYEILTVGTDGNAAPQRLRGSIERSDHFVKCNLHRREYSAARASFQYCTERPLAALSLAAPAFLLKTAVDPPAWLTCSGGCCGTDQT
jgi:hypothetical protein